MVRKGGGTPPINKFDELRNVGRWLQLRLQLHLRLHPLMRLLLLQMRELRSLMELLHSLLPSLHLNNHQSYPFLKHRLPNLNLFPRLQLSPHQQHLLGSFAP